LSYEEKARPVRYAANAVKRVTFAAAMRSAVGA
jgi:hypothetical protein